ncbi:MAG: hypothetical protein Q9Q13_00315 [Acidobacteriota bacterium]|nr:hypothetical protein [Acidobacteriota bacterium]
MMRLQRAWAAERALTGQRLHYAAVFYGADLASAAGSLAAALDPPPVTPAQVRAAVRVAPAGPICPTAPGRPGSGRAVPPRPGRHCRLRWPPPPGRGRRLAEGPLGSRVTVLPNGLEVGILPETGNDVFGIHLLVADRGVP